MNNQLRSPIARLRTLLFLVPLLFLASDGFAKGTDDPIVLSEFKTDGCTYFPDGDYRDCCVAHDLSYHAGGSWTERWKADTKLYKCVAAKEGIQHKFIAPLMWLGVRAGGVPWIKTPFRWGFGRGKQGSRARKAAAHPTGPVKD
jgi:hypothetical protein